MFLATVTEENEVKFIKLVPHYRPDGSSYRMRQTTLNASYATRFETSKDALDCAKRHVEQSSIATNPDYEEA
jgi:hypothetical protein